MDFGGERGSTKSPLVSSSCSLCFRGTDLVPHWAALQRERKLLAPTLSGPARQRVPGQKTPCEGRRPRARRPVQVDGHERASSLSSHQHGIECPGIEVCEPQRPQCRFLPVQSMFCRKRGDRLCPDEP